MVVVEPKNTAVLEYEGLHLYHAHRSNCSGRVRLLLEEKGLPWVSHHIQLAKRENVTEDYFGINPKGVVPSLIHDGKVVTESNDILAYLEEAYPDPGFRAVSDQFQPEIDQWLKLSGDTHMPGIKTIQYYKINAAAMKKTDEEVALYRRLQKDPAYLEFHGKHDLPGQSFSSGDADKAQSLMDGIFVNMDGILANNEWLVGDAYTLADISWSPSITTLMGGDYDFDAYPHLKAWYDRISKRPAFEKAITEWRARTWDDH
ncbi:MAG: glutathione S-transferase family protein [Rhodospirillales bacterium]|jgi:GST-like protein|nr:glutathione S-transferase [Rhodospirillaceae bacterium]MDP6427962.1 glutathione S-transferase family protein [Rhodospirillales bacterium]MDP6645998.1 glutathione S-transferase family protein [Rhodospirillales bacterium]MDP6841183.1 glutathione S-transferase family protein [Rhodospirillales bacterium]|tara:strand:+ start:923 stop:1699 length:777 start_codon:yes stop_codon:yes gene_type:complete